MWKEKSKRMRVFMINQTSAKMLTAVFLILLLITAVFYIFARTARDVYIKEKQSSRLSAVSNISYAFEKLISNTQKMTNLIYANNAEEHIALLKNGKSSECAERLSGYITVTPAIDNLLLVTVDDGKLTGASTRRELDIEGYFSYLPYSYEEIMDYFETSSYAFMLIQLKKPASSNMYRRMEDFSFIQQIVSSKTGEVLGLAAVNYKKSDLRDLVGLSALSVNESFLILNEQNQKVLQVRDEFQPNDISFSSVIRGYNGSEYYSVNDERIELYGGNENNLPYKTLLCGRYEYNVWNTYGGRISFVVIIICVCAVILFYFISVSFFQNKAIQNVWKILKYKDKVELNKILMEDAGSIEGMVSKQIIYANQLEKQNDDNLTAMRNKILTELFTARTPLDTASLKRQFERVGIPTDNRLFAVAVFEVTDLQETEESAPHAEQEYELLRFVVKNIFRDYGDCSTVRLKEKIVCLYSSKSEYEIDDVCEYSRLIIKVVSKELSHKMRCGVGSISDGLGEISHSYCRAEAALELADSRGQELCDYREVNDTKNTQSDYTRLIESKYHFLNLVKSGEFESARSCLEQMLQRKNADIQGEFLPLCCYEVLSAFSEHIFAQLGNMPERRAELGVRIEQVLYFRDADILRRSALEIFDSTVSLMNEMDSGRDDFLDNIFEIVEHEYSNPDLSVAYIADAVGQNSRTLSAKFIKKTGKGLLDYIHSVRIDHAKKLLMENGKTVQEVSELTGYENPNTFIRVFKRYCGITPGYFQEMYKGKM